MTTKKTKRATRRVAMREKAPNWRDIVGYVVEAVANHLQPKNERMFTVVAFAGHATHEKLGELQLPVTEAANWALDALAKFPTATKFEITGRHGYSLELFTVRNGRVYPLERELQFDGPSGAVP